MLITNLEGKSLSSKILKKILKELNFDSIKDFQKAQGLKQDGLFGLISYNSLYKLYLNARDVNFNGHFWPQEFKKNQIVLHHSASADSPDNMFNWWRNDGVFHVATSIGISDSGEIVRGYKEEFWAHHIGMRNFQNLARNQQSVAVEIMNWGYLTEKNGKYFNYVNREIPKEKVIELSFRGHKFFEAYTDKEIEALRKWILVMAMRFNIPLKYNHNDLWEVSSNAINGVPGIYTHCSYISSKADVVPQPKLVNMLKNLEDSVL